MVDILLPAAKMLKYLGFRKGADAMFGTFVLTWIATRQFGLLLVIVGIYEDAARLTPVDTPELVDIGPYDFVRPPFSFLQLLSRSSGVSP